VGTDHLVQDLERAGTGVLVVFALDGVGHLFVCFYEEDVLLGGLVRYVLV
jgi:hypothetical protein